MTEFGAIADIDMGEEDGSLQLPGVRSGDMSKRAFHPEICVSSVRFSPTGNNDDKQIVQHVITN